MAINHLLEKRKQYQLYSRLVDMMKWRKNENVHKENLDLCLREAAVETRRLQSEQTIRSIFERHVVSDRVTTRKTVNALNSRSCRVDNIHHQHRDDEPYSDERAYKRAKDGYDTPSCPYHTGRAKRWRNYISQSDNFDKAPKHALSDQHRKAKNASYEENRKNGVSVGRIASRPSFSHWSLLRAIFAKEMWQKYSTGDQGADAYFIFSSLPKSLRKAYGSSSQTVTAQGRFIEV